MRQGPSKDTVSEVDQPKLDRILIVFLPGLGNAILLTPMLQALRNTHPDATIDLFIREPVVKSLLKPSRYVDNFVYYDHTGTFLEVTNERIQAIKRLRLTNYDVIFSTGWDGMNKESLLIGCLRADQRIGYRQDCLHNLLFNDLVDYEDSDHEVVRRLALAQAVGANGSSTPRVHVTNDAKAYATTIHENLNGDVVVGMHPGSSDALKFKRWSPERFAAVVDGLDERYDCDIILFGGDNEVELANSVTRSMSRADPVVLTGQTSIQEVIATIGGCDTFLSNDSGLMHVAAERGVPVVAIFGPTSVQKNAPLGDRHTVLQQGESPDAVPVVDVLAAMTDIIDSTEPEAVSNS